VERSQTIFNQRTVQISVHFLSCSAQLLWRRFLFRDSPADLARVLRSHLQELGGVYFLVGQILSLRYDCFPPAFCEEIGNLADTSEPLDPAVAIQVIEQELGRPLQDLFSSFDKSTNSVDWLGQAHMAAITDDDPVVVTIRRPGLASMVNTDLAALRVIVGLIDFLGILGRVALGREFPEFRRRTFEGLTLITEARKADRLAAQSSDNPRQYVPQVYWSHTASGVMTRERVNGTSLAEIVAAAAAGPQSVAIGSSQQPAAGRIDLPAVARNLLYNHLHQMLNGKYVHCSPRPAILTVLEDNTIGYCDFRAVERIESRFSQQQMDVISAVRAGDVDSLFRTLWEWVDSPNDNAAVEFEASFHQRVSEWLDLADDQRTTPSERDLRRLIAGILDDFRRFQIPAPAALLAYYHAFSITTMTIEILAPDLDMQAELAAFFQAMLTERIEKSIDTRTLAHTVLEW
jgi:ubiquinone biosynthesis protein